MQCQQIIKSMIHVFVLLYQIEDQECEEIIREVNIYHFTFISDPIVKEQGRMSSMSGQSPTPMSNAGQMGGGTDNTKQR